MDQPIEPLQPLSTYKHVLIVWWFAVAFATLLVGLRLYLVVNQKKQCLRAGTKAQDVFLLLTFCFTAAVTANATRLLVFAYRARERTAPLDTKMGGEWWTMYLTL